MEGIVGQVNAFIETYLAQAPHVLIAIDGRCAAGKTTLAASLHKKTGCNVLHMDHFFLQKEQRTKARLDEPGGNVDYERFLAEALIPLRAGGAFAYRPYDCKTERFAAPVHIEPHPINIVEGSYSCHPALVRQYDGRIFLTVEQETQMRRILKRNGDACATRFFERWIPLEERYFAAFDVMAQCDAVYHTDD